MAGIAVGIIAVIGDGGIAGIVVIGEPRHFASRPEQARVAGLFFVRAAGIRC
jgi:hypothetical protein